MLDSLLGRKELKERIAALEEERDSLQAQLEAEQRRRSDAVSDRQAAEEQVNRLEDRITELEDRVQRLQGDDETDVSVRHRDTLTANSLETVLDRLDSFEAPPEGAITASVNDDVPDPVADVLDERTTLLTRNTPCVVCVDDTALVSVALEPPINPDPFCELGPTFSLDRSWFEPRDEFALALVRSDVFAVGRYDGDTRTDIQGFQTDVKSDHSKGGFSQSRFERIREGQIADHLDRAHDLVNDLDTDRLFVVGTAEHLDSFAESATATAAVDATGDPEAALEDAFRKFWTTTVTVL